MFQGFNFQSANNYAAFPQAGGYQQQEQVPLVSQVAQAAQAVQVAQVAQVAQAVESPIQQAEPTNYQTAEQQKAMQQVEVQQQSNVSGHNEYEDNYLSTQGSFMILDGTAVNSNRQYSNTIDNAPGYTTKFGNGAIAGKPVFGTLDPNSAYASF